MLLSQVPSDVVSRRWMARPKPKVGVYSGGYGYSKV